MIRFTIPYPKLPKGKGLSSVYGLNAIYAGKHWAKRQKDSEYWHVLVQNELRKQGIKRKLFQKPVRIAFSWDDKLDVDNHAYMAKMITDALKGYLITDDSRKYYQETINKFYRGDKILVEIEEINHAE